MKTLTSALALAVLLTNPASAIHYEISEHDTSIIVHVEGISADHAKPAQGK